MDYSSKANSSNGNVHYMYFGLLIGTVQDILQVNHRIASHRRSVFARKRAQLRKDALEGPQYGQAGVPLPAFVISFNAPVMFNR